MTPQQRQLAATLGLLAGDHAQWLSVIEFGMATLLADQFFLMELIEEESNRRGVHVALILEQLRLRIVIQS